MNGTDFIIDTNAIIYLFSGKTCMIPYQDKKLGLSVISEMELLSFSKATAQELQNIKDFINANFVFPLDENIKNRAILVRRTYGTKLPDSIVAATAIENKIPLLSADKGLRKIQELNLILLDPSI